MSDVTPLSKQRSRPLVKRPRREVDRDYLEWLAQKSCAACGRRPVSIHHPRMWWTDACAGRRASDFHGLPLDYGCHQGQGGIHHSGNEQAWWDARGLDPQLISISYRLEFVLLVAARPDWMVDLSGHGPSR